MFHTLLSTDLSIVCCWAELRRAVLFCICRRFSLHHNKGYALLPLSSLLLSSFDSCCCPVDAFYYFWCHIPTPYLGEGESEAADMFTGVFRIANAMSARAVTRQHDSSQGV